MTKRINEIQRKWMVYKAWHEEFGVDEVERSWGPNVASGNFPTPREFFNLVWDFSDFRDDLIIITKNLLDKICKKMAEYGDDYGATFKQLQRQAENFEIYFGSLIN
jgi:hypothetical protein